MARPLPFLAGFPPIETRATRPSSTPSIVVSGQQKIRLLTRDATAMPLVRGARRRRSSDPGASRTGSSGLSSEFDGMVADHRRAVVGTAHGDDPPPPSEPVPPSTRSPISASTTARRVRRTADRARHRLVACRAEPLRASREVQRQRGRVRRPGRRAAGREGRHGDPLDRTVALLRAPRRNPAARRRSARRPDPSVGRAPTPGGSFPPGTWRRPPTPSTSARDPAPPWPPTTSRPTTGCSTASRRARPPTRCVARRGAARQPDPRAATSPTKAPERLTGGHSGMTARTSAVMARRETGGLGGMVGASRTPPW